MEYEVSNIINLQTVIGTFNISFFQDLKFVLHHAAKDWNDFELTSFTLDFVKHLPHTSLTLATDVLEMMMERQMEMDETDANNV